MSFIATGEFKSLIYVTSDLQAARAAFAVPRGVRTPVDNRTNNLLVDCESLIVVSIQGCLRAAAANVGFKLNHIWNGVTTVIWQESAAAAGTFPFEHQMRRQLRSAAVISDSAVEPGKVTLTLEGAPAVGSWLQVGFLPNFDVSDKGTHTALGGDYAG